MSAESTQRVPFAAPEGERHNALWERNTGAPIGVIIPTCNRLQHLLLALGHLERQSFDAFEVVVVDDGSSDGTGAAMDAYLPKAPFALKVLRVANSGPARARNVAARALRAPVCLLIGDDIFAAPGLVGAHLKLHREHPEPAAAAVGLTRWAKQRQTVTPLMRWLDRDGIQFAYGELERGVPASWKHFYTSNLSLKTALLREQPFHEGFRLYGMEDIELGYRLHVQCGLQMYFLPGALAEHLHPTTFERTCRRAIDGGRMFHTFAELWPEHRQAPPRNPLKRLLLPLLAEPRVVMPVMRWTAAQLCRVWCPHPLLAPTLLVHDRYGYALEARERKNAKAVRTTKQGQGPGLDRGR